MMEKCEAEDSVYGAVWSLPATIGFTVVIGLVFIYAQLAGLRLFIVTAHPDIDWSAAERLIASYQSHGIALSYGMFASAIVCIPLVLVAIKLKKKASLRNYLGLRPVGIATFGCWLAALFTFLVAFDLLLWLLGRPVVPEFSENIYRSAQGSWILWLAIVVVAPAVEEIFFRGFLFPGLAASIPGPIGATIITASTWAALHIQYDHLLILNIFIIGLILGWARHKTGSIWLTCGLHLSINLGAMLLTAFTVPG